MRLVARCWLVAAALALHCFGGTGSGGQAAPGAAPSNSRGLEVLGDSSIEANDPDGAIRALQQAAMSGPQGAARYVRLGLQHAEQGRLDAAAAAFERALVLAPDNRSARFNHARIMLALGRPDEAVSELERLAEASTAHNEVTLSLIEARLAAGERAQAIAEARNLANVAREAGTLAALGRVLTRGGELQLAGAVLRRALSTSAGSPVAWLELSRLRQRLGDQRGAVEAGELAARLAPDSLEAVLGYAEALISAQLHERARSHLMRAGRAFEDHAAYSYTLGVALFGLHHYLEAAAAFQKAADADASWSTARFLLGTSWLAAGEARQAVEAYRSAVDADPRNPLHFVYLSRAYDEIGPQSAGDAVDAARQALRLDPDNVECLTRVARQELEEGRLDEARKSLESIVGMHADIVKPRILLARTYYRLGMTLEAEAERRAIRALHAEQEAADASRGELATGIPSPGLGIAAMEAP